MTLTGSNFVPGISVTWNGSYRTTKIIDATHVSVAIPAGDLAQPGSATITANNPERLHAFAAASSGAIKTVPAGMTRRRR